MGQRKVVVLSSGLLQADGRFPNFQGGAYLGGQVRMEAAVKLAQSDRQVEIILLGGYDKSRRSQGWRSQQVDDMSLFMQTHAPGVHQELLCTLPCTRHNLVALINSWKLRGERIAKVDLLTNAYHMPRVLAFAQQIAVSEPAYSIQLVPLLAEEVLGRSVTSIVGDRMDEYRVRLAREQQGLQQIEDGSYQDSCLSNNAAVFGPLIAEQGEVLLTKEERVQSVLKLQEGNS